MRRLISFLAALGALALPGSFGAELLNSKVHFAVSPETGAWEARDIPGGAAWKSDPARFGEVSLLVSGKVERCSLTRPAIRNSPGRLALEFKPLENREEWIRVEVALPEAGTALDFSFAANPKLQVESLRLLDRALEITDLDRGYAVVPVREGLLVPSDSGLSFAHTFDSYAYEGFHMLMLGLVKAGAAAMLTWDDPYVAAELRSTTDNMHASGARQALSTSLSLRKSARGVRLHLLGKGDYLAIGKAYRQVAKERGWLVTWDQKLKENPARAKYFGASNYKLWSVLDRRMNEDSSKEEAVRVNWTFDEAAQVAEHLKTDLKLDRVLFMMGGWIRRGYDNQHPDILPTAPECGGDVAFAAACKRIRELGYILSLHDNYQDIYRDSPSWDERWIQKNASGALTKGGKWAGGLAYITCSQMALELARRPQNLTAVAALSGADSYFIDTTYAAGLQECFDPKHPLTRADDLRWKQAISDYARGLFGSFGSECGREWAIPHADFFEGLTGVSGSYYHNNDLVKKLGASVIPFFEMVYRDSIGLYGKYGYNPESAAAYVLHHIAIGRPLHYHNVPAHLYWKQGSNKPDNDSAAALYARGQGGWTEGRHVYDRFVKNTHEILSPLHEITARTTLSQHQFLTADRNVQRSVFGEGPSRVEAIVNGSASEYRHTSKLGGDIVLPPFGFAIESSTFAAFCATSWNGLVYEKPALFTMRSLDEKPLAESKQVRVFHAFGDSRLKLGGRIEMIATERVLSATD